MPSSFRHLRRLSWIALLAILSLALVPTVSRALMATSGAFATAEVCSATEGAARSADDAAGATDLAHASHIFSACAFCALGGIAMALPTTVAFTAAAPAADTTFQAIAPARQGARRPWADARPRAPPARA